MTIVEFLDECLKDDLRAADDLVDSDRDDPMSAKIHERAIREVDAKRVIIDEARVQWQWIGDDPGRARPADLDSDRYLRALATVYLDRQGFNAEWTERP